jgi:hypothetical protein
VRWYRKQDKTSPKKQKNRENANNKFSIKELKLKVRCTNKDKFSDQIESPNLEEVARAVAVCEDPKRQQLVERALKPGDRRSRLARLRLLSTHSQETVPCKIRYVKEEGNARFSHLGFTGYIRVSNIRRRKDT